MKSFFNLIKGFRIMTTFDYYNKICLIRNVNINCKKHDIKKKNHFDPKRVTSRDPYQSDRVLQKL
jgi:hypothetical protein